MASNQSRLMKQLKKQQKNINKIVVEQEKIEDIYQILTKIQSKNLMLVELLVFLIQKGFVRNQHPLYYFMDIYDNIKKSISQQNQAYKTKPDEQQKFSKKKFVQVFKQIAKKLYPCDPQAFQNHIYSRIVSNTHQQEIRIKVDENLKKFLTRETINLLRNYQKQLQIIFQIYMPENFNNKLNFSWQQLKYLQKKLPIIAVFRFLWDSQICVTHMYPTHFFEITSKLIPPHSLLAASGQKQGYFYSPENILNYSKQSVNQKKIKLLQGDVGVSFFEFQMLIIRLSIDVSKQKNDFAKSLECFFNLIKLKEVIASKGQTKGKPTKFQQAVKIYFQQNKKSNKNSLQLQKRETKKKIQQILQVNQQVQQDTNNDFNTSVASTAELLIVKKSLQDDHLPQIPQKPVIQKENNCKYNINQKNVIIGQQLPKIPQKNKPVAAPKKPQKNAQLFTKYKPQLPSDPNISSNHYQTICKPPNKHRMNTQFPILLSQPIYPNDIPNIYIHQKSQIYLETCYIHLGQRSYQKSYTNYVKAKTLNQSSTKNQSAQFYFCLLQGMIYEASGKDDMALLAYHRAKDIVNNMVNKDVLSLLKYYVYRAIAGSLYHMQQYQLALRCLLKSRELRLGTMELESVENAILENNMGCIYMILNRNNQAMKHFALSQKIMDFKLGKFNEKSIIVQQNEIKNKKAFIQIVPTFKTMWKTYEQKPNIKPAVKASSKKK